MYDMNTLLDKYELGKPEYKPKLLEQILKMEEKRAKQLEHNLQKQNLHKNPVNTCVNTSITTLRNEYENKLSDKNILINDLLKKIKQYNLLDNIFLLGERNDVLKILSGISS
jgi:membrane-anchored protein YejM (alkaline phosphatase superfamily)